VPRAVPVEVAQVAGEAAFIGGTALTMCAITLVVSGPRIAPLPPRAPARARARAAGRGLAPRPARIAAAAAAPPAPQRCGPP
jgi:hypothetical protein